jgi:Protein of unknown function (DUF3800)
VFCAAGYFDESDDNERAYSVAGFLGHQRDCVYLHWVWEERILKPYHLEYFKASELNAGTGQFAQHRDNPKGNLNALFSQREKELFNRIKRESIDVFLDFLLIGIGAVVMLPDYYRLFEEFKAAGKVLPDPYFLCAQLVMMESGLIIGEINESASPLQKGYVRPTFDSQKTYKGRAKLMFDDFKAKNPLCSRWLLPPNYEDEKDYIALQAADNLAYECRRLLITEEYDTHIPERKAMTRLKEHIRKIYRLHYDSLKMIIESKSSDSIPITPEVKNEVRI